MGFNPDNNLNKDVVVTEADELEQLKASHMNLHARAQFLLADGNDSEYQTVEEEINLMHVLMETVYHLEVDDDYLFGELGKLIDENQESVLDNEEAEKKEANDLPLSPLSIRSLQSTSMFSNSPSFQPIAPPNTPVLDDQEYLLTPTSPR